MSSVISIPCGLHIYDREIELTIEPVDNWEMLSITSNGRCVGRLERTPEIEAAINAALDYEKSIEDKSKY